MHFLVWALTVLVMSSAISYALLQKIKETYEERIDILNKDYSSEITAKQADYEDAIGKRDKEITNLTLENINLTHENDILDKKLKDLEQKYEIKTSMCLGLQKNSRMWHESYEELESHITEVKDRCSVLMETKETEHQKEIEDLTQYYKEKIQHYTHPVEGGNCQNVD